MTGIIGKIIGANVSDALSSVGKVIDDCITNDQERLEAKRQITEVVSKLSTDIAQSQRDVLVQEMQGNWLQKSWRPILMLAFGFIVIYHYFLAPIFGSPNPELPEKFWTLLEIGIGGYVVGRSAEKIAKHTMENIDKIPSRKQK